MRKRIKLFMLLQVLLAILAVLGLSFMENIILACGAILLITVFAIFTLSFVLKSFVSPIEKVCEDIREVGDNSAWGECLDASCELNLIDSAFQSFLNDKKNFIDYKEHMENNYELMHNVFATVNETNNLANTVDSYILTSADGAHNQALQIASVAKSLEEMNLAHLDINKSTAYAAELAQQTRLKAEDGDSSVKDLIDSIVTVHSSAEFLKGGMSTLLDHAQNVNDIMNVITEIADQTNLLALNAAIEAARAGEAGRGFSVVADEVRKLAEKTMLSTTGVAEAVLAIQQSVKQSTSQVDTTVKNVNIATELATNCAHALREIVDMAESSADQVRIIAVATEEQSASSEEIANTVMQVNNIAMENEASLEEAKRSIFFMQAEQTLLTELMDKIKENYK